VSTDRRANTRPIDQRQAADAGDLERANQELRALSQLNADLVALLAHDVGQPLTSIIGYAETAIDEWEATPDELKLDWVDRIHLQARRLGETVDDVLAMCRLEAGAVQACRVPVVLGVAVDQALDSVPLLAGSVATPAGRLAVLADPGHLQQILVSLLTNAARHGRPPVQVDTCEAGDGLVELRVRDHGGGVHPELVPRLFDRVARATGPAAGERGTGLGLFIAKRLAEANGATLRYEPAAPAGACFTLGMEAVRPRPPTPAGGQRAQGGTPP